MNLSAIALQDKGSGTDIIKAPLAFNGRKAGTLYLSVKVPPMFKNFANDLKEREQLPVIAVYVSTHHFPLPEAIKQFACETMREFVTHHVHLPQAEIVAAYGTCMQNNFDEGHDLMYRAESSAALARMAVSAAHTLIQADWEPDGQHIQFGEDLLTVPGNKRKVFTWVMVDHRGFYFSETGFKGLKDWVSKHMVHTGARGAVRGAGTFRICQDDDENVLVLDNDSGTYRPDFESVLKTGALLEKLFPGLRTRCLDRQQPQPEDTFTWRGPLEKWTKPENGVEPNYKETGHVYKGCWKWEEFEDVHSLRNRDSVVKQRSVPGSLPTRRSGRHGVASDALEIMVKPSSDSKSCFFCSC